MYDSIGNLYPVQGANIDVVTTLKGSGRLLSPPQPKENFTTDETGKYQVRFIKRTHLDDATRYNFTVSYESEPGGEIDFLKIYLEDVINAPNNVLVIDTIKLGR